jgi:DnaK suppressor protein
LSRGAPTPRPNQLELQLDLNLSRHWHAFCLNRCSRDPSRGGSAMRSIKRELESTRNALSNALTSSARSTREDDHRREIFKDPYGTASLTHDDEVQAAVVDRRSRQLEEVNRALADIDAGRYGICRECGEPIAKARLKVMPFATRCVACQAQLEGLRRAA